MLNQENAVLLLVDHQVGLLTGLRDHEIDDLRRHFVGLAKAARILKLPVVVGRIAGDAVRRLWRPLHKLSSHTSRSF